MRVNSVIIPAQLGPLVSGHQSHGNTLSLPPTGSCHFLGLPVTASACGGLGLVATENISAAEDVFSKKQMLVVADDSHRERRNADGLAIKSPNICLKCWRGS
jgi:hypothetical protein